MDIGKVIRQYRKSLEMTQAQLAQGVGVSVQAISKWETGAGYPDIAQIIPLARALGITTDALLDFTDRREHFEKLWSDTLQRTHCDPRQMREVSRAALEVYPEDKIFLLRAAVDEQQLADMAENEQERESHLRCALQHCYKLLRLDPEDEDTKVNIVGILTKLGKEDEALAMAWECQGRHRELALRYCLKGKDLRRHRQKIIDRKLSSLLQELWDGDLGMLDAAEGIIRAAIPDGNYQHYYEDLAGIYLQRFIRYRAEGNTEAACAAARQVLALAKEADGVQGRGFTAPLFDLLENINPDGPSDRVWRWLLSYVEMQIPQWREEADLAQIVGEAYAYRDQAEQTVK